MTTVRRLEEMLMESELATFRLLLKFHRETQCGDEWHWAECESLVDSFGYVSWESWEQAARHA